MTRKVSLTLAFLFSFLSYGVSQCSNSSIEATGDSSFCSSASGNLNILINTTIPNNPTYVWSPSTGLSNSTIKSPTYSVTSTTSYTVKVTIKDNYNWINNGDFEQGNTGFTSGHGPGTGGTWGLLSSAGTYAVSTNPQATHTNFASCSDHTPGAGNNRMMVVNGSPTANVNVWCQSVPVNPNTNYRLVLWGTSVVSSSPAILRFRINGTMVGNSLTLSSPTCTWQKLTVNWNSGNATNANICIRNQNTSGAGNDFAIDDIQFKEDCVFRDTVVISVGDGFQKMVDTSICSGETYFAAGQLQSASGIYIDTLSTGGSCDSLLITNLTVVDHSLDLGNDSSYCVGDSVLLDANLPNSTYLWNDNSTLATNLAVSSGTYMVTVTSQEGCQKTDSVSLTFNPQPQVDLGQDTSYCSGDSITLNAFNPQATYSWQDNSTQAELIATASNLYSVTVTSLEGCEKSDEVNLTFYAVP
ncbi:MAG: hypothetical protein HKN22_04755, partial [Bacteroidia bacterium]|nr:hypothetical protein [Bacteroidia bacterium]